eukprot:366207-Chlamydomonas_euryale.AAC.1
MSRAAPPRTRRRQSLVGSGACVAPSSSARADGTGETLAVSASRPRSPGAAPPAGREAMAAAVRSAESALMGLL